MKTQSKNNLTDIARAVASRLEKQIEGNLIKITNRRSLLPRETNTDGWNIGLGKVMRRQLRMDIWLDKYSGYPERKMWYGFVSSERTAINELEKLARQEFGKPKWIIREKDYKGIGDTVTLRKRLDRSFFGSPIPEYYDGIFYYGVYDYGGRVGKNALIEEIAMFYETIIMDLPDAFTATYKKLHLKPYKEVRTRNKNKRGIRRLVHDTLLNPIMNIFRSKGFKPSGMKLGSLQVDLLGARANRLILVEAKTNKSGQGRDEARQALGQLYDYRWHLRRSPGKKLECQLWTIFENRPRKPVVEFLEDHEIVVGWVRDGEIGFGQQSEKRFNQFTNR